MNKLIKEFLDFLEISIKRLNSFKPLYFSNFENLKLLKRGKVRDIYDLGDALLLVSTDRISAFDVILPTPIPFKGMILNMISYFWFDYFKKLLPNHLITANVDEFPSECGRYKEELRFRSMLVRKLNIYGIECIVRGYLAGSGYEEYKKSKSICGITLPEGLVMSSKLPQPIFTPSTKQDIGHDENITFDEAKNVVGDVIYKIRDFSIGIFNSASKYLEERGIILCDTKFEFGYSQSEDVVLVDEVLTPDSSRFWFKELYQEGKPQESYDKQFVRDYLKTLNWNKTYPGPDLPDWVVRNTLDRYATIFKKIVG
ncbi:MAG: phosphoribosylaminoimidazolesuccinocarboxamide synthase [Brevinematia bacterium]